MTEIDKKEAARAKLAQLVAKAFAEMFTPEQIELRKVMAMDRRARYLEYIAVGFDPDQALKLCAT